MGYYAIGDNQYFISHHGVMGMHWGIRRFQPYGAGGYNRKNGATGKEIGNAKKTSSSKSVRIASGKDFAKDNNLLTGPYKGTKRQKEAADLGLEAMKRARLGDTYALDNMKESERESFREWFMVEDQTIGYGLIADQVNQGKTKHEIKAIIDTADKMVSSDESHAYEPGVFELFEYKMTSDIYIGDKFLDSCIAIRDQSRSLKHSFIFIERDDNMTNYSNNDFRYYKGGSYLAHYGKKGMKWGKHLKATTDWWDTNVTGSTARSDMKREQKSYQLHSKIANENRSNFSAARRTVRTHIDPNTKSRKMWKMWTGSDRGNDYEAARRVAGHAKKYEGNAKHHSTEASNALKRYHKAKESYDSSLRGKAENTAKKTGRKIKTNAKKKSIKIKSLFKKKKR